MQRMGADIELESNTAIIRGVKTLTAAPVMATGQEIDATMRQKIVSNLKARVRATSEGKGGYRGKVISAMIDADYELKIGDKVLKGKGELLSLTAKEAAERYGEPPEPLLAAGMAKGSDLAKRTATDAYLLLADALADKDDKGNWDAWWEDRSLAEKIVLGVLFGIGGIGLLFLFGCIDGLFSRRKVSHAFESLNDLSDRLFGSLPFRLENDLGIERFLLRVIDPSVLFDLSSQRFLVKLFCLVVLLLA
jgi:hypothetical protein